MIANLKDIIFFFYMTILSVVAFGYGLSIIPSPAEQKNIKLDAQRVSDLDQLVRGVEDYYYENKKLPPSLDTLSTVYLKYKDDPETKKAYEYRSTGSTTFKLCATFTTDSSKTQKNSSDPYDYYTYGSYKKFDHPKGHKCFDQKIPTYMLPSKKIGSSNSIPKINKNSTATAKLSSLTKKGACKWEVYLKLNGFSANSPLAIQTNGKKTEGCDAKTMHDFGYNVNSNYSTDSNGTAFIGYTHNDYGSYTYTFTDQDGNQASVKVEYSPQSTAHSELSSIDKKGPCQWIVRFKLKGYAPNSPITVDSRGRLSDQCDPAKTHDYGWAAESTIKTANDGTAIIEYSQGDYGTYNYTFTDKEGNSSSVKVEYNLNTHPSS